MALQTLWVNDVPEPTGVDRKGPWDRIFHVIIWGSKLVVELGMFSERQCSLCCREWGQRGGRTARVRLQGFLVISSFPEATGVWVFTLEGGAQVCLVEEREHPAPPFPSSPSFLCSCCSRVLTHPLPADPALLALLALLGTAPPGNPPPLPSGLLVRTMSPLAVSLESWGGGS